MITAQVMGGIPKYQERNPESLQKNMHYREMKYLWDRCNIYVLIVLSDEM
jgi:hypothetical protein